MKSWCVLLLFLVWSYCRAPFCKMAEQASEVRNLLFLLERWLCYPCIESAWVNDGIRLQASFCWERTEHGGWDSHRKGGLSHHLEILRAFRWCKIHPGDIWQASCYSPPMHTNLTLATDKIPPARGRDTHGGHCLLCMLIQKHWALWTELHPWLTSSCNSKQHWWKKSAFMHNFVWSFFNDFKNVSGIYWMVSCSLFLSHLFNLNHYNHVMQSTHKLENV